MRCAGFLARLLALLCLADLGSSPAAGQTAPTSRTRLFMPAISGEPNIGPNVTTVLNLQIWRTLRKSAASASGPIDFGQGKIAYSEQSISPPSADAAEAAAQENVSQLVLYGDAAAYGDGVVVQAFLLASTGRFPPSWTSGTWNLKVKGKTLALGLPRQVFDFGPVLLRPEVVAAFSNPGGLRLCPAKTIGCTGPPLGSHFTALAHEGPWTRARAEDGRTGWISVPELGRAPNEISDFVGAMIAYYRGDFEQSGRLFRAVMGNDSASALIRQDAMLLAAASDLRHGKSADELIARAREENPYSRYALQLEAMAALSAPGRNAAGHEERLRALAQDIEGSADLFPDEDPWLEAFRAVVRSGS